ncbi:hypothetical protein [Lacimicrobium sp. SS2-24]|uniref:hypothetical protein n=1 Tax=Lacimicrobium sp. SS2-24 TaxID=2005569 RepID=UPI000B4C118A|nr:hypothetical protein [Lacimicrobium sp. SS2-24]
MLMLHNVLLMFHIAVGSAALLLFWVPALTKKGSMDHNKFGRYYANVMYLVAASGFIMSVITLMAPLAIHGSDVRPEDAQYASARIRQFAFFLLYLSWLVLTSIRHGVLVLKCKNDRGPLLKFSHLSLLLVLFVGGIGLFIQGVYGNRVLDMIFAALGMFIAAGMLHYVFRNQLKPRQWWVEHLGAMIGSGIGAYTAFFAFGARAVLADSGYIQLIAWVAPGVIGSIVIAIQSRKYTIKFTQSKVAK